MTSEVLIMNPSAIALASDSAVSTLGQRKVFPSANKLFALSKFEPVGVMVYGNASLMELPWETIIKEFRRHLWDRSHDTLKGYADEFIGYLESGCISFSNIYQDNYIKTAIAGYFGHLNEKITENVEEQLANQTDAGKGVELDQIKKIIKTEIDESYKQWKNTKNIESIGTDFNNEILKKYGDEVDRLIKEEFEKIPLTKGQKEKLKQIAGDLFSKFPDGVNNRGTSGVVIAGFGKQECLPSYVAIQVECCIANKLKYRAHQYVKVDPEEKRQASITAFAQGETIAAFIEGIDPKYKQFQKNYLSRLFEDYSNMLIENVFGGTETERRGIKKELDSISQDLLDGYWSDLVKVQREQYINPIVRVITVLPKQELAEMAESMVNLVSFKKKVTAIDETVGGPIDVAVISKGDGFIWIKRKHYFKPELNMKFFENYFRRQEELEDE